MTTLKQKLLLSSMFAGIVGGVFAVPAIAQEDADPDTVAVASDTDEAAAVQEKVYVTGSRIVRDSNLTSSIPVTALGLEDIQASGAYNIAEVIRDLPQAGVPGLTASTTNFSVFSGGLESIDLRNLGDSRTLVLMDGRRVVPGAPGTSIVDFSMIPPDFIKNIEVVTGGASSVYGSEAIAGVVNIILKDDFEGVELNLRGGSTFDKGGEQGRISLTTGGPVGEKGNFIANVTYDVRDGIFARDTDHPDDEFYLGAPYGFIINPAYSSYSEYGRFDVGYGGTFGNLVYDNLNDSIEFYDDVPGAYGYNRNPNRRILIPQERYSAALKAEYEINPYVNLNTTLLYAHVSSDTDIEPFPLSSEDIYDPTGLIPNGNVNNGIPLTNPLIPQAMVDAAIANGFDSIAFARRMTEIAYRTGRYDRETLDLTIGVDGPLGDTGWTYDAYINHGRSASVRIGTGQINVQNMRFALDAVDDGNGNIICRDATARAFGCVPINIWGKGVVSPEAAAYVSAPGLRSAETEQTVIQASVTGDAFQLPAGAVGLAFGMEYRELSTVDQVDALTAAGLNAGNRIDPTIGAYDVYEVFGEVLVPLLKDVGFIDNADFEAAYRTADYSSVGGNDSWKYGITASMFDEQLRFRAVGARAARAPDIGDLYSGNAQSFTSTSDPCAGITTATTGNFPASCLQLPGVQAALANNQAFFYNQLETQSQYVFFSGSELLKPEVSDSYTVGFVFQPKFLEGFSASIDYVNFEIDDAITSLSTSRSARLCMEGGNVPGDPTCANIIRDPNTSKILYGFAVPINAATFKTDGIDVQVSYSNDVPTFGNPNADYGSYSARILYGHTNEYEYQSSADSAPTSFMGSVGYPDDKFNVTLGWDKGPLSLGWQIYALSEVDYGTTPDCDTAYAALYANYYPGSRCYHLEPDWYIEHSFNASYRIEDWGMELYGNIDNVFDEFVYLPSGLPDSDTGLSTAGGVFDPIGRRYTVGLRKTW
ncbi:MAG: TonB-dependent receptor [Hyphomonas sp.]